MNTMNRHRANWARAAVDAYASKKSYWGGEEEELIISDLVADILHLCDQRGIDRELMLERATGHHAEEVREEEAS